MYFMHFIDFICIVDIMDVLLLSKIETKVSLLKCEEVFHKSTL